MKLVSVPNRRYFRYSLRTLFGAMTLVALWLGWELRIIRERQTLWKLINESGGYTMSLTGTEEIPMFRAALGDKTRGIIALPEEHFSLELKARIESAFPEALVLRSPQDSIWREGDEDED